MSESGTNPPAKDPADEEGLDSGFGDEATFEIPAEKRPDSRPPKAVPSPIVETPHSGEEAGLSSGFGEEGTVVLPASSLSKAIGTPAGIPPSKALEKGAPKGSPFDSSSSFATVTTLPEMKAIPQAAMEPPRTSKSRALLIIFLFTWASIATILAAWLWMNQNSMLENLPDDGSLQGSIVSPLEWLSGREMVPLGSSLRVGALEVTPLRIENRPVEVLPDRFLSAPVLVMYLRIKNVSLDQEFHPSDPAFLYPRPERKLAGLSAFDRCGYTYTFLHPAGATERLLPPFDLPFELGHAIAGQEFVSLKPGESTELMVISGEEAFGELKSDMVWRVKLRKGKSADGKGIATVIGVTFQPGDVKQTVDGPRTS